MTYRSKLGCSSGGDLSVHHGTSHGHGGSGASKKRSSKHYYCDRGL